MAAAQCLLQKMRIVRVRCGPATTITAIPKHYRPKSEVTEEHGGQIKPVLMPDGRPHPGYYWVAYDWRNLFPLCARCSRNGKGSQFPIKAERVSDPRRGPDPEILDRIEVPKLLNPYKDHPAEHLKFGVKGVVTALSEKGRGVDQDLWP